MSQQREASEGQGIHFVQAAQRVGVSVQRLMHLERTGVIEPPVSLEQGRGRIYTEEELDAVVARLSRGGTAGGSRTWWLAAAGFAVVVVAFAMLRGPSPKPAAPAEKELVSRPAATAKEKGTRDIEQTESSEADFADKPERPQQPEMVKRWKRLDPGEDPIPPDARERIERDAEQLRALHKKGIYH